MNVRVRELHALIDAEFQKAKADYYAEYGNQYAKKDNLEFLYGKYAAWSAARELSYKAVNGE